MTDTAAQDHHFLQHAGAMGLVIVLHIAIFLALKSGLTLPAKPAQPREIIATLIAAQPAPVPRPEMPAPQPPKPKAPPPPKPKPAVQPRPEPAHKAISRPAEPAPEPAAAPEPPSAPASPTASAAEPAAAPAGPPGPPAPVQPKTVTSGLEYLQPPQTVYPALSRRMGEEGTVTLRILINERGRTERVEIHKSSGVSRLDEAARQGALRAVFKPYMENGRPIPVYAILPVNFQLNN